MLDLARPGTMSVLTAADLRAVKDNAGDFNKLVFKQQRLRLKDSSDLHISASLKKLGVQAHNGLACADELCGCVNCLVHDTYRRPDLRLSINSSRPPHLRLKVPEKYVTGDPFGVAVSDAKVNALLRKYAGDFKKPEAHDQICLSDDEGNDDGARGFSAGAGATTNREVIMDANTHSKSVAIGQKLQRERNEVALRGYAEDMRQLATGADEDTVAALLDISKKRPREDPAALEEMRKQAMTPEMMAQRPLPSASHPPPRVCPPSPSNFVSSTRRSPPHRRQRPRPVQARRRHARNHAAEGRRGQRARLAPAHRNLWCLRERDGRDDACDDGCQHLEAPADSPKPGCDGPRGRGRGAGRSRAARRVHGWRGRNRFFRRDG